MKFPMLGPWKVVARAKGNKRQGAFNQEQASYHYRNDLCHFERNKPPFANGLAHERVHLTFMEEGVEDLEQNTGRINHGQTENRPVHPITFKMMTQGFSP
jgi:hypothetical protein